ncbi:MAG: xanthine dehydrogenase family protein subunit M [Chitinophagaceae bacterium]
MRPFKFSKTNNAGSASKMLLANPKAKLLAGGTNILDLMKEDVERPNELIDITHFKLAEVRTIADGALKGGLTIGALSKNTDTANHPLVRKDFPLLTQAILAGASVQIRNMATNGGNLNQRTRCPYFYDTAMPCNKREPGTGCGALDGVNRMHAIFGWSASCVATHPSDMCVALAAHDAVVKVQGADGKSRSIAFPDYHLLPGDTPHIDNSLKPGEIIIAIDIPTNNFAATSYYLKVRDRASYAFALVSVAAALETSGSRITKARIALGGVAHKPWRATEAENFLAGKDTTAQNFRQAAELAMSGAKPLAHNQFKIEMGRKAITQALKQALTVGKAIS